MAKIARILNCIKFVLLLIGMLLLMLARQQAPMSVDAIRLTTFEQNFDCGEYCNYSDDVNDFKQYEQVEALFGSSLTLRCPFELEADDRLYSIKWHKKINKTYFEFYSFIATFNGMSKKQSDSQSQKNEGIIHRTPMKGILLDERLPTSKFDNNLNLKNIDKKNEDNKDDNNAEDDRAAAEATLISVASIRLINISLETEGTFRCEAITDDTFQVVRHEFRVTVYVPARDPPLIFAPRRTYGLGERIQLTCISGKSRPPSNIRWFINDISVPLSYIKQATNVSTNKMAADQLTSNESEDASRMVSAEVTKSELDFMLRHEHVRNGNFSIRCMSFLDARFYPEVRNSKIEFGAWSDTTPVIVGLREEYKIGDWIDVNCSLPALWANDYDKRRSKETRMEWLINAKKASSRWILHYFRYGLIGLRFRLESYHFTTEGTFSIECVTLQLWPTDIVERREKQSAKSSLTTNLHYNDDDEEEWPKSQIPKRWPQTFVKRNGTKNVLVPVLKSMESSSDIDNTNQTATPPATNNVTNMMKENETVTFENDEIVSQIIVINTGNYQKSYNEEVVEVSLSTTTTTTTTPINFLLVDNTNSKSNLHNANNYNNNNASSFKNFYESLQKFGENNPQLSTTVKWTAIPVAIACLILVLI